VFSHAVVQQQVTHDVFVKIALKMTAKKKTKMRKIMRRRRMSLMIFVVAMRHSDGLSYAE
jgi:hypothetical protein